VEAGNGVGACGDDMISNLPVLRRLAAFGAVFYHTAFT
jgi:hypothetical protein